MPNNSQSFERIRANFIEGFYKIGTRRERRAGIQLHNLLQDVDDLLPLLNAENEASVYLGVYIAQEEGESAKRLFPAIFNLLDAQWTSVRSEVLNCFVYCSPESKHLLSLLSREKDHDRSVRLGKMRVFHHIHVDKLESLKEYAEGRGVSPELTEALEIFLSSKLNDPKENKGTEASQEQLQIFLEKIDDLIHSGSSASKMLLYLAASSQNPGRNQLKALAKRSGDEDIADYQKTFDI